MKSFYGLNLKSVAALGRLKGGVVQGVCSPSAFIEYGSPGILVDSVSIGISAKEFVVIQCDWEETDTCVDYWEFFVDVVDAPKGITASYEPTREAWNFFGNHFFLNLDGSSPISKISILRAVEDIDCDSIEYDAGIVVVLESGVVFSLVRQDSISGLMWLSIGAEEVAVSKAPFLESSFPPVVG